MAKHKIIIAGVGRSGTSFLFEEVAAALKAQSASSFFYEPYLWAPEKVNLAGKVSLEPFDTRNLSPFGIYVHCGSPLFLKGTHPVHDQMLTHILDRSGHVMAKMIRGNGRLRSYLNHDPKVKVVGILRDVVGTVNSAANHFSFFGEEFHPTDLPRFRREVSSNFGEIAAPPAKDPESEHFVKSALWWKYMNLALLELQADFPDRVCVVDYGSLKVDPDATYDFLEAFLGIPLRPFRLKERVGIVSSAHYIDGVPLELVEPFHDWLRQELRQRSEVFQRPQSLTLAPLDDVMSGYDGAEPGVVPRFPPYRTVLGWRFAMARNEVATAATSALYETTMQSFVRSAIRKADLHSPAIGSPRPSVSVIIPAWNAETTLESSVAAVWDQTGVNAEVVIVDDASTDGTAELASRLLEKGPGHLVRNLRNLGPGLSRHKGVLAGKYELVSTLDADDFMLPLKLSAEAELLGGRRDAIAFSDVIYKRGEKIDRWTFDHLPQFDRNELVGAIAGRTTSIPRDMTFHRALYNRTRGFDSMLRMYEDWSFKIECAAVASQWLSTGELGVQYEHKVVGLSAGDPSKHRFFLHAAFLKHAEMLALRFGARTPQLLRDAMMGFGCPNYMTSGLDLLKDRSRLSGNLIHGFDTLRSHLHKLVFRTDLTYDERLKLAYDSLNWSLIERRSTFA